MSFPGSGQHLAGKVKEKKKKKRKKGNKEKKRKKRKKKKKRGWDPAKRGLLSR